MFSNHLIQNPFAVYLFLKIGKGDGFAIIKAKKYVFRKIAKLYSNFIAGPVCMRFYFYLHGKKTGQIKILTKRKNSKSEITMFKQFGNHGHHWNFAQVFLDFSPSDIFQVNFLKFLKFYSRIAEEGHPNIRMATF